MICHGNIVQGCDNSLSVYNDDYKQSYHSKSLGAYTETLLKHIYPALFFQRHGSFCNEETKTMFLTQVDSIHKHYKDYGTLVPLHDILQTLAHSTLLENLNRPLCILDICFGLGYNAMLSLQYFKRCEIYSPEKDYLLKELSSFSYHKIPQSSAILNSLIMQSYYKYGHQTLYYLHGNACMLILQFSTSFFDVVFQDAFSRVYNGELWDLSYFKTLYRITKTPCIITTYAKARPVIEVAKKAGFHTLKYVWGSVFYK